MTAQAFVGTGTIVGRRPWFAIDAVVTGVNAVAYIALGGVLVDVLGGDAATYRWIGAAVVFYAAAVAAYAWTAAPAGLGWAVVAANEVWVVGSLVVAATGGLDLDPAGRLWVVAQAVVVGALALLQARALRARG